MPKGVGSIGEAPGSLSVTRGNVNEWVGRAMEGGGGNMNFCGSDLLLRAELYKYTNCSHYTVKPIYTHTCMYVHMQDSLIQRVITAITRSVLHHAAVVCLDCPLTEVPPLYDV